MKDIYENKNKNDSDWYASLIATQAVLCSILSVVLCLMFHFGNFESLREGYGYLTEYSLTKQETLDAIKSIKHFVNSFSDAEF